VVDTVDERVELSVMDGVEEAVDVPDFVADDVAEDVTELVCVTEIVDAADDVKVVDAVVVSELLIDVNSQPLYEPSKYRSIAAFIRETVASHTSNPAIKKPSIVHSAVPLGKLSGNSILSTNKFMEALTSPQGTEEEATSTSRPEKTSHETGELDRLVSHAGRILFNKAACSVHSPSVRISCMLSPS
jgi:hypothetical protein